MTEKSLERSAEKRRLLLRHGLRLEYPSLSPVRTTNRSPLARAWIWRLATRAGAYRIGQRFVRQRTGGGLLTLHLG
jgi:hypothetical protein